jgi:hypothetical protein
MNFKGKIASQISVFIVLLLLISSFSFSKFDLKMKRDNLTAPENLYNNLHLDNLGLNEDVFYKALNGWSKLNAQHALSNSVLSIADFTQSSNRKRFYVIDVKNQKLLFNTYVSHGRNSGEEFAKFFSNEPSSFKSSLGFYITGNTYEGKHGLSLQLKGIENGINDLAEKRAIVIHGAAYVSESFIHQFGRLGRSEGCPALPEELSVPIVEEIKEGSCLFIYSPDIDYLRTTKLLD